MTEMTVCEALEAIKLKDISFEGNALRVADFARGLFVAEKALEKQIAIKPKFNMEKRTVGSLPLYACPSCKEEFADIGGIYEVCQEQEKPSFCPECGQALDWSDIE